MKPIIRGWTFSFTHLVVFALYALLTALASTNRETSLLLVFLYAAHYGRQSLKPSLLLLAIWALVTASIHLAVGPYLHMLGLENTLLYNLSNLPDTLISNLPLLPLAWLAVAGYRGAPSVLQRLAWVALGYMVAIAVGASWSEVQRLCLPLLPLILPLIVGARRGDLVYN